MSQRIAVGIDIGSHTIKVLVAEAETPEERIKPRVIGLGYAEARGMRHGYVANVEEASNALKEALAQAEKSSGYKINKAYLAVGGIGLSSGSFSGSINLGEKDIEITSSDILKLTDLIESEIPESFTLNREILHAVNLSYKIDGKPVLGKPWGMFGSKIEGKCLFVTCLAHHIKDFLEVASLAGIDIEDVTASPFAASLGALNKSQQVAGCVLLNIGGETTSISTYENGVPISLEVLPIGSSDITNDIALGLKVSLEEAERIKLAKPESVPYPRKKLEEIISARLSDIFDLVESHLKKIGRNGLLPAGIIITGGGALCPHIEALAKQQLKLPAKKSAIKFEHKNSMIPKDGTWAVSYGLAILGMSSSKEDSPINLFGLRFFKGAKTSIWGFIKKILP